MFRKTRLFCKFSFLAESKSLPQRFCFVKPICYFSIEIKNNNVTNKNIEKEKNKITKFSKDIDPKISEQLTSSSKSLNSITNPRNKIVFVNGIPKNWVDNDIISYFDPKRTDIVKVNLINNRLGKATGKALITFTDSLLASKYIEKWHDNWLESEEETNKLSMYLFGLQKENDRPSVKAEQYNLQNIYAYNLPFTCTADDLYKLAGEFGEIAHIDMPVAGALRNKGFAFIYFKNKRDAKEFMDSVNDMEFMGRNIKYIE